VVLSEGGQLLAVERGEDRAWLTVAEAADRAGVSRQTMHVWMRRSYVMGARIGRNWLIERASLDRMIALRSRAAAKGVRLETIMLWIESGKTEPSQDGASVGDEVGREILVTRPRLAPVTSGDGLLPANGQVVPANDVPHAGAEPRHLLRRTD